MIAPIERGGKPLQIGPDFRGADYHVIDRQPALIVRATCEQTHINEM